MKTLFATFAILASLLLAAPAALACGEENTCNNRPAVAGVDDVPKTRSLKRKVTKEECDENSCD